MTAITARLDTSTTSPDFLRGLALGIVATLALTATIVAVILFASWTPAAGTSPTTVQPPQQVVDENHPIVRPGGVKLF